MSQLNATAEPQHTDQQRRGGHDDYQDDVISLEPMLRIFRIYRKVLIASLVAAAVIYMAAVIGFYLWLPGERYARLAFQPRFEGASLGRYPNGLPFSSADITADAVVQAVFESNQMERFGRRRDFRESLVVVERNPELELLDAQYKSLLADTKLAVVDRQRLEDEYRGKRAAARKAEFLLTLRLNGRLTRVPNSLVSKVLNDILNEWASQAVRRKGVLRYDITFPSAASRASQVEELSDVYAAAETLRQKAELLSHAIQKLSLLPGAGLTRVSKEQVTIADIAADVSRLLRFQIEPLCRELSKDPGSANLLQDAARAAILNRDEARRLVASLQDALRLYEQGSAPSSIGPAPAQGAPQNAQSAAAAVAPQVSESFIDRLVQLSTRAANEEFRQNITNRIIQGSERAAQLERDAAFLEAVGRVPARPVDLAAAVRRLRAAEDQLQGTATQATAAYEELSEKNLAPATALFSVSGPVTHGSESSLIRSRAVLLGVLFMFVTLVGGIAVCWLHASFTDRQSLADRNEPASA